MDFNSSFRVSTNLTSGIVSFQNIKEKSTETVSASKLNSFLKGVFNMLRAIWPAINGWLIACLAQSILDSVAAQLAEFHTVFQQVLFAEARRTFRKWSTAFSAFPIRHALGMTLLRSLATTLYANRAGSVSLFRGASALATSHSTIDVMGDLVAWYVQRRRSFLHAAVY